LKNFRIHHSFAILFSAVVLAAPASAQVNVLTANYDNQRTNSNLQETVLNQSNVNTSAFGKIGYFPVDGEIYAQPLYASGIQMAGKGTHNVVYIATMHNSLYAIDADTPASTVPLWQVNFGPSVPSSVLSFNDILPEVGVLSTPVIDLSRQIMYVVSDTLEAGTPVFHLHALSLADGHEMLNGPVAIAVTVNGHGAGNTQGKLIFDPSIHLQRPGLALVNGRLYLGFGSRADMSNWHGWLMSYDASTLTQLSVVTTSPDGYGASIWQGGRAPAIDSDGNLFVSTGNGDYDGSVNFGESVLKFSGADLTLLDWYTPDTWSVWNLNDQDLGSGGVILVPNTNQLIASGKSGDLFLIRRDSMGHLGPKTTATVQNIQANQRGTFEMALWNNPSGPIVYVQELDGELRAYQITNGTISGTAMSETQLATPTIFAGVTVSGNSTTPASAIVWHTTGDTTKNPQPGTLHAYDASDLSHEFWNSDMAPGDQLGRFAKLVAPTVANGKVFVPTFSNELVIYGLLSSGSPSGDVGPPQVTAVTNGANFLEGAVSPGELVAVFGANFGPAQLAGPQVDGSGHLTTKLSHTKVFIDGIAAPLLYASANQVGAIVPFGITASSTEVVVQNGSEFSSPFTVPVVPATPALFSTDGTGGKLGAIVNQDGKRNTFGDPAPRGSIVTMWATGAGQMNPGASDGQIVASGPFPAPRLPVTALIDNKPAEVLYAGASPGMVEGVIQINVRVPATASTGEIQVVVQVGSYPGPNTVTLVAK
jgi:uncharacterized protein (TIGR03437 family)